MFHALGIYHPDDMSAIILTSYNRRLNHRPLGVYRLVHDLRKGWATSLYDDSFDCPWDGSMVQVQASFPSRLRDGIPAPIFAGRCKAHGHLWAAQFERGTFRPSGELLARVRRREAVSRGWR